MYITLPFPLPIPLSFPLPLYLPFTLPFTFPFPLTLPLPLPLAPPPPGGVGLPFGDGPAAAGAGWLVFRERRGGNRCGFGQNGPAATRYGLNK